MWGKTSPQHYLTQVHLVQDCAADILYLMLKLLAGLICLYVLLDFRMLGQKKIIIMTNNSKSLNDCRICVRKVLTM